MRVLVVLTGVWLALGVGAPATVAHAQSALRDAQPGRRPARSGFTLRPEAGLEDLAARVAAVLELRTGARVEVGPAPPPGLLEAVPAGHIAMALTDTGIRLVLGAVGGRSLETVITFTDGIDRADPRSIALAAESLHDTAQDGNLVSSTLSRPQAGGADVDPSVLGTPGARHPPMLRDDLEGEPDAFWKPNFLRDIELLTFVRTYGGATTASTSLETGVGAGAGVCAVGHCLYIAGELPLSDASAHDIRYRYPTFSAMFYSRPFHFGDFTPGASVGLLTRVGHFRDDMGLADNGVDTDLGTRAVLELAWEASSRVDIIAEVGADYALDRWLLVTGGSEVSRGDRLSPWMQASLRVRPY